MNVVGVAAAAPTSALSLSTLCFKTMDDGSSELPLIWGPLKVLPDPVSRTTTTKGIVPVGMETAVGGVAGSQQQIEFFCGFQNAFNGGEGRGVGGGSGGRRLNSINRIWCPKRGEGGKKREREV